MARRTFGSSTVHSMTGLNLLSRETVSLFDVIHIEDGFFFSQGLVMKWFIMIHCVESLTDSLANTTGNPPVCGRANDRGWSPVAVSQLAGGWRGLRGRTQRTLCDLKSSFGQRDWRWSYNTSWFGRGLFLVVRLLHALCQLVQPFLWILTVLSLNVGS